MRRRKRDVLCVVCICLALLILYLHQSLVNSFHAINHCTAIDVVYTWVNGSDPNFIASARRFNPTFDPARFDDKNELRYSLRSLELHAPWIRHVYIVTNGQIPHWLDLTYERVTVVPHTKLTTHPELLPTFSSAAIETFLHLIPGLSKRFLYMNDDIFLGAPLYLEDLYTEAEGVRIYQAWMVPDCAEDCPWTYIGDGACDRHCNIAECQFDGDDCSGIGTAGMDEGISGYERATTEEKQKPLKVGKENLTATTEIRKFPNRKRFRRRKSARNGTTFKDIVRHRNVSTLFELHRIVESFNNRQKTKTNELPALDTTPESASSIHSASDSYKSTKDIYSESLIHTNMLLNRHYGFKARNVLAHVGFLFDRRIITAMQTKFADEAFTTAAHRFRSPDDLQYAFAYYSFLMSEVRSASVEEIFDEFDTDSSQTWSDREVRTFLTRMYPLPLDWSAVHFFEEVVSNCSRDLNLGNPADAVVYSTLVYERYEDSNLPTITRELVAKCTLLADAMTANFALRPKYKYNINSKRLLHNNFVMLTSNITEVVDSFDKIRRNPRKFNCINDNLVPQQTENNELIRHLLEDFYLSFFPRPSKFELPGQYRNRFADWHEYQQWRRRKRAALVTGYCASIVLVLCFARYLCVHKAKYVRRYWQLL